MTAKGKRKQKRIPKEKEKDYTIEKMTEFAIESK